jgi:UrcA family protein
MRAQRDIRGESLGATATPVGRKAPFVAVAAVSQKDFGPVSNAAGVAAAPILSPISGAGADLASSPRKVAASHLATKGQRIFVMFIRIVSALGALAATAATVAFATPAAAQAEEERSVTVSIAGLDLSNPTDAVRLDRRLRAAAQIVCGPDERMDVRSHHEAMACQKSALARANADVQLALRGGGGSRIVALTAN